MLEMALAREEESMPTLSVVKDLLNGKKQHQFTVIHVTPVKQLADSEMQLLQNTRFVDLSSGPSFGRVIVGFYLPASCTFIIFII